MVPFLTCLAAHIPCLVVVSPLLMAIYSHFSLAPNPVPMASASSKTNEDWLEAADWLLLLLAKQLFAVSTSSSAIVKDCVLFLEYNILSFDHPSMNDKGIS